jgi:hypothetical protein
VYSGVAQSRATPFIFQIVITRGLVLRALSRQRMRCVAHNVWLLTVAQSH